MGFTEGLPAVLLISAPKGQPRTFIILAPSHVPGAVEQALQSVTDVSFTVPDPHFASISKSQVSIRKPLEDLPWRIYQQEK